MAYSARRYYYVSLALRENILRVNGSNIRPWWITHHYLSSFMSIVLLTWPEGENYNKFLPQFNLYVAAAVLCSNSNNSIITMHVYDALCVAATVCAKALCR